MAQPVKRQTRACWPSEIPRVDKKKLSEWFKQWFEQMGIEYEPRGVAALHEEMRKAGIDPRENLFSRGIIEMREE